MLDRSDGPSLRSGFLAHARNRPEATAAVVRGAIYSYGQLDNTARRWAGTILRRGRNRPERVGIFAYRSDVAYAGTLAALYSGATFVPLNPTFPPEKTAAMIAQADLNAIVIDKTCLPQAAQVLTEARDVAVLIPEFERSSVSLTSSEIFDKPGLEAAKPLEDSELPPLTPEDVAYLLFTSGSTGVPKGVPVTHGNATYFMDVMSRRYRITPDDRFSQTFDQTFDLSVFDLFMAWTNGACVYGMSPVDLLSPTKFINQNQITVWFSVPSVPAQMRRRKTLVPGSLPSLRLSLFCGEPLPEASAAAWQEAAPNSVLENLYGPTELTIACFVHRWDPNTSPALCRNGIVPIGRPYDGLSAMVLDPALEPVPAGETGELCVSGPQTTPGYWRAPEKTAERYVEVPVSRWERRRFYRTGDLVARLPEGEYVFLGRADTQIKVLGHRIELGEIEAVLLRHPSVVHAVAFGWPAEAAAAEGIIAFVSGNDPDKGEILALAKAGLPPYVVPRELIVVPEMPLNANGKVDRRALKQRLSTAEATTA